MERKSAVKRAIPGKKLLISLMVILGVLVAADFGAAAFAEHRVAEKMRTELELERDPRVRINGFPFLYQAARGDFRDVRIRASGVAAGPLRDLDVQADLRHAKVATSRVLAGTANKIKVEKVVGRIRLNESDIGRILEIPDLHIRPAPRMDNKSGDKSTAVRLDGTVNIASTDNHVTVVGRLSLSDGKLHIEPRKLDLENSSVGRIDLPEIFEKSILRRFRTTVDPGNLPFTVTPTAVRAERGALVMEGRARNLTIDSNGVGNR